MTEIAAAGTAEATVLPPGPGVHPPGSTRRGSYAGFISRAIAFGIDLGVIALLFAIVQFVVSAVAQVLDYDYDPNSVAAGAVILTFGSWTVGIIYFTLAFTLFGRTVGKLLLGLRVVRPDGRNPGLWRSFLRAVGYSISALLCYLGFIMAAFTSNRQALHDKMAGTHVVYTWEARRAAMVVPRTNLPLKPHGDPPA